MPAWKGLIWQGGQSPPVSAPLQWAVTTSQLALDCVTRQPVPSTLMFLWLKPGAEQAFVPNTYCVACTPTVCLVLPPVLPGSVHTSHQGGQDCLTSLEDDSGHPKGTGLTQATDCRCYS